MYQEKLTDKQKLDIINQQIHETHAMLRIIVDALEYRCKEEDNNHSDCIEFLRDAQDSLGRLFEYFEY